jgi:hypothetical protein
MIRLTAALLAATATTAVAVEPQGWCTCNPDAPACRSIRTEPDPPLMCKSKNGDHKPGCTSLHLHRGRRGSKDGIFITILTERIFAGLHFTKPGLPNPHLPGRHCHGRRLAATLGHDREEGAWRRKPDKN